MPCYLIVNADDFGLTEGVSRGIIRAHREGIVTSTTLMVNFPWAPEMVKLLRQAPDLGVGIHLNLTVGAPVLSPSAVPSLVGPDGRFAKGLGHLLLGIRGHDVLREWKAQVEKGIALLGRLPTHLDTHKYVQAYPGIATVFAEVARAYKIPAVRVLDPGLAVDASALFPRWVPAGFLVPAFLRRAAAATQRAGLRYPQHCLVGNIDGLSLLAKLDQVGEGVTELVCHPGYVDAPLHALTSLLGQREVELAAVTAPATRRKVAELGLTLVTFGHLGG